MWGVSTCRPTLQSCCSSKERSSFLKKRSKKLLSSGAARLLADIAFGANGNADRFVTTGWAEAEAGHRWTLGRESRLNLPRCEDDCVLVIDATPCLHAPGLRAQTIMLAINDRLLATAEFPGLRVFAFRLPRTLAGAKNLVLSIIHLNCESPRAPEQVRGGQPLGLMMHSIRIYALNQHMAPRRTPTVLPRAREELALCFESLGQGCQFGQIQRQMGAEPLNLLRFVDTVTSSLVDGLVKGFAGIDTPGHLSLGEAKREKPSYTWQQSDFKLSFDTLIGIDSAAPAQVLRDQLKRLTFLQRKFIEDLSSAEKIYVLTRSDVLTEPEALAVFCALNLYGPNTLLWTVFGDESATGQVIASAPRFLRAQLGWVDEVRFAPLSTWYPILEKAHHMAMT
jgi:hypothetical protein